MISLYIIVCVIAFFAIVDVVLLITLFEEMEHVGLFLNVYKTDLFVKSNGLVRRLFVKVIALFFLLLIITLCTLQL